MADDEIEIADQNNDSEENKRGCRIRSPRWLRR